MPVHNSEIADLFNEVADLLEIEGNPLPRFLRQFANC